jgi:hypothetical protein
LYSKRGLNIITAMPQLPVSFNRIAGVAVLLLAPMFADAFGYPTPDEPSSAGEVPTLSSDRKSTSRKIRLQSSGLMYGNLGAYEGIPRLTTSSAIFALYSPVSFDPFIFNRAAVTNPIQLAAVQTYTIPFTTNPILNPGTYFMMALYDTEATPRTGVGAEGVQTAYWYSPTQTACLRGSDLTTTMGITLTAFTRTVG